MPTNEDILHKQTAEEFKQIIMTTLVNQRYQTEEVWNPNYYDMLFESFTEGDRVLALSEPETWNVGTFQFVSVVNSFYCYIKLDSRDHIDRWEKHLVRRIGTRQMASTQQSGTNEQEAIVLSDAEASSEASSNGEEDSNDLNQNEISEEEDSNDLNQNGMGVARARNDNNSNSLVSSIEHSNISITISIARARHHNNSNSFTDNNSNSSVSSTEHPSISIARARHHNNSNSFSSSESGHSANLMMNQNQEIDTELTVLDDEWLTKQGFTINPIKDIECVICREPIPDNQMVFDIKCYGTLKHPLHTECAQKYIAKKHTSCPVCRFLWKT